MPIDSADLCSFSKSMLLEGASEVQVRAAGSRAYYAAYHSLLWLGERLPPSVKCDPKSMHVGHRELQRRISEWRVEGVHTDLANLKVVKTQVSLALESARKFREVCDYELSDLISRNEANAQIERARRILRHAKQFHETVHPEPQPQPQDGVAA